MAKFVAVVRKSRGPWQHRVEADTARDVKRKLARKLGFPIRWADALPMGKTNVDIDGWGQVHVYEQVRRGWRQQVVNRLHRIADRV